MSAPVTVWRSKHALSVGVKQIEVWDDGDGYGRVRASYASLKFDRDIHMTRAEAVAAVEKARSKKIDSLEKQIAKLRALDLAALTSGGGE